MKNSEIAEGAREVLETHGWIKGQLASHHNSGRCLVGAALTAMGVRQNYLRGRGTFFQNSPQLKLQDIASQVFLPVIPGGGSRVRVMGYNDSVTTTKKDVLDVCDRAAKYWRDKGE